MILRAVVNDVCLSILGITWQVSEVKIPHHSACMHALFQAADYFPASAPFTSSKGPRRAVTAH